MQTLMHRKGKFNKERVHLRLWKGEKRAPLHKKGDLTDSRAMKRHTRREKEV